MTDAPVLIRTNTLKEFLKPILELKVSKPQLSEKALAHPSVRVEGKTKTEGMSSSPERGSQDRFLRGVKGEINSLRKRA